MFTVEFKVVSILVHGYLKLKLQVGIRDIVSINTMYPETYGFHTYYCYIRLLCDDMCIWPDLDCMQRDKGAGIVCNRLHRMALRMGLKQCYIYNRMVFRFYRRFLLLLAHILWTYRMNHNEVLEKLDILHKANLDSLTLASGDYL